MATSTLILGTSLPTLTYAQTKDEVVAELLKNSEWGYKTTDKELIKPISKTASSVTLEIPVAYHDGNVVTDYYLSWGSLSLTEIKDNYNMDDLTKMRDSDSESKRLGAPVYKVEGNKIIATLDILEPNKDVYLSVEPLVSSAKDGKTIEDYKFNLSTLTISTSTTPTAIASDIHDAGGQKAIINVTCVWDNTANRVTLLWDVNTALSANKVEISHRGDVQQGAMTVKGTPHISEKRFVIDTPHRNLQLFRLKPIDANNTMVGYEIQYECKPDNKPADPKKPIPVTGKTGPMENTLVIVGLSIVAYVLYRRFRTA